MTVKDETIAWAHSVLNDPAARDWMKRRAVAVLRERTANETASVQTSAKQDATE